MPDRCPHAVRTHDVSLRCRLQEAPNNFCGFQYLCKMTKRFENTQGHRGCLIRKKHEETKNKKEC